MVLLPGLVQSEESLLDGVLRILPRSKQSEGDGKGPAVISIHQCRKGTPVAILHFPQELFIALRHH